MVQITYAPALVSLYSARIGHHKSFPARFAVLVVGNVDGKIYHGSDLIGYLLSEVSPLNSVLHDIARLSSGHRIFPHRLVVSEPVHFFHAVVSRDAEHSLAFPAVVAVDGYGVG